MKTSKLFAISALAFALVFTSCDDNDDPVPVLEEELITTFTLTLTNTGDPSDTVVFRTFDADGADGPTAPVDTVTGTFTAGATYTSTMTIENEIESPAEDVLNDDIIPEKDEHFFVYVVTGADITMTRASDDEVRTDGNKLGLKTRWVAGSASTGTIQVRLIHEPTTVNDDNEFGTATGGSEDINRTYSVTIQ